MSLLQGIFAESYLFTQLLVVIAIAQQFRRNAPIHPSRVILDEYVDLAPSAPNEIREVKMSQKRPTRMGRPPGSKSTPPSEEVEQATLPEAV